jgi:sRNA-binding protein
MRGSPGKVTDALMHAATSEAEREEETRAKEVKEAKKDEQEAKKTAKKEVVSEEPVVPVDGDLVVGSIVITSSRKEKDRYDNFRAEVLSIKKLKVRVKFLEGPCVSAGKDMQRNCLTLADAPGEPDAPDEPDAKRQKKADDLFGPTL